MIKLGSKKKYIEVDGSSEYGEIVYINEFNYVITKKNNFNFIDSAVVNFLDMEEIAVNPDAETLLKFIGYGEADVDKFFVIRNKPIGDVDKKYRTIYKELLKSIEYSGYCGYEGIYRSYYIDDIPMCVNLNEVKKFYLQESFMYDFENWHTQHI